jgi:hypothetical protein
MQGDDVWLEAKNLVIKGMRKLLPKRYGPFKVLKHIRQVVYQLKLSDTMKIHNMFHINLLTPYCETSSYGMNYVRPPPVTEENDEEYKVENIQDARRHERGHKLQYLVHWKGYPAANNSWVNHSDLNALPRAPQRVLQTNPYGRTKGIKRHPNLLESPHLPTPLKHSKKPHRLCTSLFPHTF